MKTIHFRGLERIAAMCLLLTMTRAATADVGANWIEQWGIRWTFDKNLSTGGSGDTYRYGQFVNGDYWVIGPVNITGITPDSHVTEAGEKDYLDREYAAVIGEATGAWTFYKSGSYWRATIPLSDTSLVPGAGKYVLLRGASGSDAAMVNGRTGTVQVTVLNESVTVSFPIEFQGSTELEVTGGLVGGAIINGSMINPAYNTSTHGYTSETPHYRPELNAAFGISVLNPLEVPVGSSLISTISRQYLEGRSPQTGVKTAAVLTVLDSDAFDELPDGVVPGDCFRPPYFGDAKPIRFWKQLLDYSFLSQLEPVGTVPTLEEMEDQFQRPWIRTAASYTSRYIHPSDNMPDYYKQIATNKAALVLNLNHSNAQKETLLVYYSQLGIDLYATYELGFVGNPPDGGHFAGFLLPILVAGKALDYEPMYNVCAKSGNYRYSEKTGGGNYGDGDLPPDYLYFQELDQTYYVSQLEVDITNGRHPIAWTPSGISLSSSVWIPNGGNYSYGDPFVQDDMNLPEYGIRHTTYPGWSCKSWDVYKDYRAQNSPYYSETAFLMLVMGLKEKVNHDAFFDYADRWAETKGQSVMRATYRANYGPMWSGTISDQDEQRSLTADYDPERGTVTPDSGLYPDGEDVTLWAHAFDGFHLSEWAGNIQGAEQVGLTGLRITMDKNKSITAVFEPIDYNVTVTATDGGTVQWSPQDTYRYDDVVVLEAKSASGYKFARWEDGAIKTARQIIGPTKSFQLGTGQAAELFRAYNTDGWNMSGMTIALWAKPESVAGSQYLLGHTTAQTAGTWSNRIQLYIRDGQLGLGLGDTHALRQGIASIEAGQWYHIALRFGNGTYTVYIGGQEVASGSYAGLTGFHGLFDVGNTGNAAKRDEGFVGEIDELRVFADIVEPDQIRRLAEGNYRDFENNTTLEITVTEDLSIRAVFTDNPYALTTSAVNGSVSRSPDRADYTTGEVVTLTANPDAGYVFTGWSGDAAGATNPITVIMDGNKTVTATLAPIAVPTYTVTFNLDGKGTRTGGGALIQTIPHGGAATAPTVTANTGWVFTGWDKAFNNITGNLTVNAQYTAQTYTLGITANNGSVTKRVNGVVTTATSFADGTVVSLTAAPNTGYTFANWSGNATGTANPVNVTMDGNKAVTANFTQNTYTLGITATNGSVTKRVNGVVTMATSFADGTVVSLTAAANTGYTFANWSGSATGTANPASITMDGNKAVAANFAQVSLDLNPVAQWLFNEPYQTTVLDLISGQAAGLINNAEWGRGWAEEYFVRLGSAQQAVQIPMSDCSPQAGTVALWVTPQASNDTQYLFGHAFNGGNRIALYTVYTANGNALTLGMGNAIALRQNIAILSPNVLYHIVLTWNNGSYAVYVDGIEAAAGSYTGLNALNSYADVGNYGNAETRTLGFRGLVEEVQLHSRALNPSEVQSLFLTHNVKENRRIEFVVNGTDGLGNPISYTASDLPQGASFDVATQTFSWWPALYNTAGRYNIHLSAPGQPTETITIAVQDVQRAGWYEAFLAHLGLN